jgi:hypothetical protein
MTAAQMQFLPDNLMKGLDSSGHYMVASSQNLYPISDENAQGSFFTPLIVFSILFIIIFLLDFVKTKFVRAFLQGFDGMFFFLTGTLGVILILMWVATDHSMTKDNFNLLWAWPTHSIIAFFITGRKEWVKKYLKFTAIALMLVLTSWIFLPQQMNNGLIPVILLLIYRSVKRSFMV